ncbi:YbaB/EbfC family nucleoid-associated protein [bacterium]|nr:YbaB/EbfC family nucleoid-associated protein [bacterium]
MNKNIRDMMKGIQKVQKQMEQVQEGLAELTVEGTAGGGMVKVLINGKQEVLEVKIDPEVAQPEEVEMLEDLLVAAFNQALQKCNELVTDEMSKVAGGLPIPPGMF